LERVAQEIVAMRVYLLNPPFLPHFGRSARWQDTGRGGTLYYPIWLSYCTAVVEERFRTRLVDAPAWGWGRKEVIDDIRIFQPDLLVIETSYPSLMNDIGVAEEIKRNYEVKIAMVGCTTSQFSDQILSSTGIDIVAKLEYEFTVRDLAEAIDANSNLQTVRGIDYKEAGEVLHTPDREPTTSAALDTIPFVAKVYKKHLNIRDYFLGSSLYPEVQILTGRGCPFSCTFCSWPQIFTGRKYRVRSVSNVLDELEWVEDNLDVKEVFFEDDTFTIDKQRVLSFAMEYKNRDLDIPWSCNVRVSLDYETMREMKSANCRLVVVGYESGNDEILKNIKKGTTLDQMRKFSKDARNAGLLVHGDFIIGLPGENRNTIEKTSKIIKELRPEILQVSVATPFPGTEFYEWVKKNNYLVTDKPSEYLDENGHQKAVVSYPWLSAEEISGSVDAILKRYYLSKDYLPIALKQIFRKQGALELKRLWRSAKMFSKYISKR
jgi:radical SAM superfamily enzyme YgiQ (UPF0313 family)